MFSGSIPALVTPFAPDDAFDETAYRDLVEWQIAQGCSAFVACGTTGEAATLTIDEHFYVVRRLYRPGERMRTGDRRRWLERHARRRAGLRAAKAAGADAAPVVAPYYNRPNQEGVYRHFAMLAQAAELPLILYNMPARRDGCSTRHACPNRDRVSGQGRRHQGFERRARPRVRAPREPRLGFVQLTGNDEIALAFNAVGGTGCISVTASVAPHLCAQFQAACRAGDYAEALRFQDRLFPLHAALFTDASPGPVKFALGRVRPGFPEGLCLPMTRPSEASPVAVDAALAHAGLV